MRNERGFTLLEIIIVLTILSFVLMSLSVLFEQALFSWQLINNEAELQHNLSFALDQILEDIRNAKSIGENSGKETITLIMSDQKRVGYGLKADNIADEHIFNLNGKVLYQTLNYGNKDPIANFIEELTFEYNTTHPSEADFVKVKITGRLPNNEYISYQSGIELKWRSFKSLKD